MYTWVPIYLKLKFFFYKLKGAVQNNLTFLAEMSAKSLMGHMSTNVSFFSSCIKDYIFETKKAWNGSKYEKISGGELKIICSLNISRNNYTLTKISKNFFAYLFLRSKHLLVFFPKKNIYFLSEQGPPRYLLFLDGSPGSPHPLNNVETSKKYRFSDTQMNKIWKAKILYIISDIDIHVIIDSISWLETAAVPSVSVY